MTDKELKKLSRLELLELLLKESKENERLSAEIEKLKSETDIRNTTEKLHLAADKLQETLNNASELSDALNSIINSETPVTVYDPEVVHDTKSTTENGGEKQQKEKKNSVDIGIYQRLLSYFNQNPYVLAVLPDELSSDIKVRIAQILSRE